MAAPVTQQVSGGAAPSPSPALAGPESGQPLAPSVAELPVLDATGKRLPFGALFRERRAVVVFVRVSAATKRGWLPQDLAPANGPAGPGLPVSAAPQRGHFPASGGAARTSCPPRERHFLRALLAAAPPC